MLTLTHLTLDRLKNAEHVQFNTNVRNLIEEADTEKIGLSDLVFTPYVQAIGAELDIVNRALGSAFTLEMQATDQKRDVIFKRIRRKLELCEYEDVESEAYKAAPVVRKHFLDKYGAGVVNLPYQEQTATLSGFIMDARAILQPEQIEAIGIDSDLDDL